MTAAAELAALRAGLERRLRDVRRAPFLAPDVPMIREAIARLERELRDRRRETRMTVKRRRKATSPKDAAGMRSVAPTDAERRLARELLAAGRTIDMERAKRLTRSRLPVPPRADDVLARRPGASGGQDARSDDRARIRAPRAR